MTATLKRCEANVAIASIELGNRMRKPDMQTIDDLAKDLAERGLLQRIGIRVRHHDGKYDLIWGRHRFEAAARLGWAEIAAVVYPPDTPDRHLHILEIVENLLRRELSAEERQEHTLRLAALIKEAEPAETRSSSEFPAKPAKGPGGRGKKGVTAKVAETLGVDPSAVRQRAKAAAEAIGEPIDLERDQPEALHAKADKLKAAPKPPKAKAKLKPKPQPQHSAPKPKPRFDLVASLRQLEADWPMQLDAPAFAAELPAFRRGDLGKTVRRLRIRLEELEAALTPSPVN